MNDLPALAAPSWFAKAHHPRLSLVLSAKTWMLTAVGMTGEGVSITSRNFWPFVSMRASLLQRLIEISD
jgi:hypothetical protein